MKVEFTPANCCPLCRPNNHPNPRYKGCLTPSAAEGKLFALSLKVYLVYVEKYTKSTVSHIFVMSASVTNCITDDKSDLCTSYSNLSLSSDIRSVVATSPRLDAAFHTKYLTIIGCGNAKKLGVITGMLSGFVAVQHVAAMAAAAGKPDDIQLHKELYYVLSNVPGTTIPATYDLAVEMMNDKGFGAAELKRAREKHGRWLGKTYGKLGNKDYYESDLKTKLERLTKEDPNRDQKEAEKMALTYASKRVEERLVAKGKPRAQKRKLEGEEKALWAKRNANNKAVRNAQNKQCWLCNTCNYSCQHGNKSRDMPNHLNKNPKCRVSKENYISNFSKDGWQ